MTIKPVTLDDLVAFQRRGLWPRPGTPNTLALSGVKRLCKADNGLSPNSVYSVSNIGTDAVGLLVSPGGAEKAGWGSFPLFPGQSVFLVTDDEEGLVPTAFFPNASGGGTVNQVNLVPWPEGAQR